MTYFDIADVPLGFNHVARCIVKRGSQHRCERLRNLA